MQGDFAAPVPDERREPEDSQGCAARKPIGHGCWTYCVGKLGHPGAHIFFADQAVLARDAS